MFTGSTKQIDPNAIEKMSMICWSYIDTQVSGSPILQNGKLIGAVTHVLVDDCKTGYAVFAENMLETAQNVAEENKLKAAS